jgi:hypothetical protein
MLSTALDLTKKNNSRIKSKYDIEEQMKENYSRIKSKYDIHYKRTTHVVSVVTTMTCRLDKLFQMHRIA